MVSIGLSRMEKASVVLDEPGVKVSSEYYCEQTRAGKNLRFFKKVVRVFRFFRFLGF